MKKKRIAFTWYLNWRYPIEAIKDLFWQTKYFIQRGLYGYADEDWWGLDDYLSTWLPNALRQYGKRGMSYPGTGEANTPEKWKAILEKMARGFEAQKKQDDITWNKTKNFKTQYKKLQKEFEEGMKLFTKWYGHLWD